jgi:hypothetical protein
MWIATLVKLALIYEGVIVTTEQLERQKYWSEARQYCDEVGKPLLVVGMKRHFWQPPDGDVTIDIDPKVLGLPSGVLADAREIPYPDKSFGAVYAAHVLEHMDTPEDAEIAINECLRVADRAYFLCPSPYSIYANLFAPSHHLRIWFDQDNQTVRVIPWNPPFAMGGHTGGQYEPISQSLVVDSIPKFV